MDAGADRKGTTRFAAQALNCVFESIQIESLSLWQRLNQFRKLLNAHHWEFAPVEHSRAARRRGVPRRY
jgi:hypothetical protein